MEIVLFPDPVLKEKTASVKTFDAELAKISQAMLETMYNHHGIGLAAPQVGLKLRLFVMDVQESKDEEETEDSADPSDGQDPEPIDQEPLKPYAPKIIVNPVILKGEGENMVEEGCLSIPGVKIEVTRPATIEVRYQNLAGEFQQESLTGLHATCFQHELDHLNGVLMWDRISPVHRNVIKKKFLKQQKQKTDA